MHLGFQVGKKTQTVEVGGGGGLDIDHDDDDDQDGEEEGNDAKDPEPAIQAGISYRNGLDVSGSERVGRHQVAEPSARPAGAACGKKDKGSRGRAGSASLIGKKEEEEEAAMGRGHIGAGSDDEDEFLRVRTRDVFSISHYSTDHEDGGRDEPQQEKAGPQPWDVPIGIGSGVSSPGKKKRIKIKSGKVGTVGC